MPEDPEHFARQIRQRRALFGWTQRQVAARGGPSTETLRLIEGAHRPSYGSRVFAQLDRSLNWPPGTALRAWEGTATEEDLAATTSIPLAAVGSGSGGPDVRPLNSGPRANEAGPTLELAIKLLAQLAGPGRTQVEELTYLQLIQLVRELDDQRRQTPDGG